VISPSQQVGEGQPGTTELIVEPNAEDVKSTPRRQTRPQTLKLVGPLFAKAEGVEQLVVDAFYDLADCGQPTPQSLGPGFAGIAFGWADDPHPVEIELTSMETHDRNPRPYETYAAEICSKVVDRALCEERGVPFP
jgi:hypothetical protein